MRSSSVRTFSTAHAPALLLAAVAIVIAGQLVLGVPLAAAVALAAWGTALAVRRRAWLVATVAIYAPLCVWAVAAEVDLAMRSPSLAWGLLVALDGALCASLTYALVRQTGQLLAAAGE